MKNRTAKRERSTTMDKSLSGLGLPTKKVKKCPQSRKNIPVSSFSKIPQIPKIHLTKAQMQADPIQLLVDLEKQYQLYGAVKLITPPEWKPPFCFKSGSSGITTRIQPLHKLKHGKAFKEKEQAYNVKSFREFADNFSRNYKYRFDQISGTPSEQLESEFWKLVDGKYDESDWKLKVTTQYAADIPVKKYGSGFPLYRNSKSSDEYFDYHTNLFNLNNLYKSPESVLKIADEKNEHISGVVIPWIYMGMQFSTFCWHVQDLWLNSLNYSHCGGTKTWYIVPKKDKQKFDQYVQKKTGKDDLLNRITFMINPLELIDHGIEVYRADQQPGEYICTFFKAYHAGFSHGFNVGEAVNFVSPKSLEYMKEAMAYMKNRSPYVLPYEWIVYTNLLKNNKYQICKDVIASEYKKVLKKQKMFLAEISKKCKIVEEVLIEDKAKYDRNSCSTCRNYQYLSSLRCINCHKNYCQDDFSICCNGEYQLVHRDFNQDREPLRKFIRN